MSNIQDLNQNLYDKYDERYMSEIDNVKKTIGYSKNLLPYPYVQSNFSYYGITLTDNGDGTLTANGTATGDFFFIMVNPIPLSKGEYILSGCPSGGSESTYSIYVEKTDETFIMFDTGNGVNFTLSETTKVAIAIRIKQGVTLSNKVFKPMVRYASIKDDTYESYVADMKAHINNIQGGFVTFTGLTAGGTTSRTINFKVPFKSDANPIILALPATSSFDAEVRVTNKTLTNFTVLIKLPSSMTALGMYWIAIRE